jgi:hypothetical protein
MRDSASRFYGEFVPAVVEVPRWKLERAAGFLELFGDELGVGAELRDLISEADKLRLATNPFKVREDA